MDLFGPFWPVLVCSGFWTLFFLIYTLVLALAVVLFVLVCSKVITIENIIYWIPLPLLCLLPILISRRYVVGPTRQKRKSFWTKNVTLEVLIDQTGFRNPLAGDKACPNNDNDRSASGD